MKSKGSIIFPPFLRLFAGLVLASWFFLPAELMAAEKKPLLSGVFTDNLVLQRDLPIPVWGWAEPGKTVQVSLNGKKAKAVADKAGKWMAKLPGMPAGGPFNLVVSGTETQKLTNVLLGDVWICSGQSNMEMGIGSVKDSQKEVANANYPQLRLYTVPRRNAYSPQENVDGRWLVCNPENIMQGGGSGFSAVGYFFGKHLYESNNVPIGLINASWGGTMVEPWTSGEALKPLGEFNSALERLAKIAALSVDEEAYFAAMEQWFSNNDAGTAAKWPAGLNTSDWKTMEVAKHWSEAGLTNFNGIVWFQREFTLPESWSGKDLNLSLGPIDDFDATWVNDVRVGETDGKDARRNYKVSSTAVKPGRNVVTIRVLDLDSGGGIWGKPDELRVAVAGNQSVPPISLAGAWRYKDTLPFSNAGPKPERGDGSPNTPSVLFNGMIAPLVPYAIKGAIWYQGEANADRAKQYQTLLPTMIQDWRNRFGVGEFPFLIVQLANYMQTRPEPGESRWAELRESQALVSQALPRAGLAVAIDIGDAEDIHPKNKQDVGLRLALAAQKIAYQKAVPYSGPVFQKMEMRDKAVRISFGHTDGGLMAKGEKLQGFAISGADKKFIWADAVIEGNVVVVSSPQVESPVAVRYAWADNPICNLYNKAGLPAVPFRTDR